MQLIDNANDLRMAFISLVQTQSAFENENVKNTENRILAFEMVIEEVISGSTRGVARPVSSQLREELIDKSRRDKIPCAICNRPLIELDDILKIDHRVPRARGGSSNPDNLQVVHMSCNLK
jgi:hypothetical protein